MISLPVEFAFAEEVEVLQAFLWYETIKTALGEDLKDAINLKTGLSKQIPQACSFIYKDIRSVKIKTFTYNLIYRVFNAKIQVIAVFHHSRNPREWRKTL